MPLVTNTEKGNQVGTFFEYAVFTSYILIGLWCLFLLADSVIYEWKHRASCTSPFYTCWSFWQRRKERKQQGIK